MILRGQPKLNRRSAKCLGDFLVPELHNDQKPKWEEIPDNEQLVDLDLFWIRKVICFYNKEWPEIIKQILLGLRVCSVVEILPGMHEGLYSIPSAAKKKENKTNSFYPHFLGTSKWAKVDEVSHSPKFLEKKLNIPPLLTIF
jgi:hypothetical protein